MAFGASSKEEVDAKANQLSEDRFEILSGPSQTCDGNYEFETLYPDSNRIEVTFNMAKND